MNDINVYDDVNIVYDFIHKEKDAIKTVILYLI